ncbi:hypothetical protein OKA04_19630 [Luteolibacter flavescens]|uniref:Transposase n=1 Tax=Luteolibacter flavescens TaxID=1859460 RepID=A0ABT3FVG3_9BACT|nr:hypothetical protein [Luteolibacter flavescens]MCW1886960.1 hypothetical protein [Luteolibacter flavescens]
MIDVTLTELAAWTIGIAMGIVVLFEWISRWSAAGAERRSLRKRVTCRLCLLVVEDEGRERTFRCPHCGADNERGRNKSLG